MKKIYLGLGSNLGDSLILLKQAVQLIDEKIGKVEKISKVYLSAPMNHPDNPNLRQNDYYNMVLTCISGLTPHDVKSCTQKIEKDLGLDRVKKSHWGPREIDIDILAFERDVIDDEDLKIPHPGLVERDFVIYPLSEIDPDFVHPISGKNIKQLIIEYEKSSKPIYIKKSFSLS